LEINSYESNKENAQKTSGGGGRGGHRIARITVAKRPTQEPVSVNTSHPQKDTRNLKPREKKTKAIYIFSPWAKRDIPEQ
jgi:hypothetical protein